MNIVDRYQDARAKKFKIDTSLMNEWGVLTLRNTVTGEEVMINDQHVTTASLSNISDTISGYSDLNSVTTSQVYTVNSGIIDSSNIAAATIRAVNYPRDVRIEGRPFRIRIDDNAVVVQGTSAVIEFLD